MPLERGLPATCKGRPPAGDGHPRARPASTIPQGRLPAARPQGMTANGQSPTANPQEAASGTPARGCPLRSRKGLSPAGATMLVAGVAAPWQGGYRPQRTAPPPAQGQRWRRRRRRVNERVRASF
ncbi:hypothetical protein BHE74_00058129 [Ensete ventricosum]|nr:hypothetical protein BHE74_00058129 [Ensete ventricosum]